ncbi:MAG: cysteine hydrolase [Chloroflexota bacterium]|nr:MAG: cysteine hydrolase [Chloroflexota bacterium]
MNTTQVITENTAFFEYLAQWHKGLRTLDLASAMRSPGTTAVFVEDMVGGFCRSGNLASPRVCALVDPIIQLMKRADALGVDSFVLLQDTHMPDAPEFEAWPPHCVVGTPESETLEELRALPFSRKYFVVQKNALNPAVETNLDGWLRDHPDLMDMIVVGDCTDLCVYQMAMHLRIRANALNLQGRRVIVPANGVQTYDLGVQQAQTVGVLPHPGDFFHLLFLYHMTLCGIDVVKEMV